MDGLLVVDKPAGPTSHDVVARVRRALGVRRIGHTGTLDPDASGVLPLVIGRATRLARFLSSVDKQYEAVVRLGFPTNTYDAAGQATAPPYDGPLPGRDDIERALAQYRGTFAQQPPAYSAKKIHGQPSYKLARSVDRRLQETEAGAVSTNPARQPDPVAVSTSVLKIVRMSGDLVTLTVACSAGFYVRSLAHDLGIQLGTGAHLLALKRTRSGEARLEEAISLASVEDPVRGRDIAATALIPLSHMLPHVPVLTLTEEGVRRAQHGRDLTTLHLADPSNVVNAPNTSHSVHPVPCYQLIHPSGDLIALAGISEASGLLHPFVVLV